MKPGAGRVHFVGVGGAGMSAIAKVLLERGIEVSGSDLKRAPVASVLEAMGAKVVVGHDASLVDGCGAVVVSSAIPGSNVELTRARELGVTILSRGEALAQLLEGAESIVVAGTHGKTTTTSMIVTVMRAADLDPTYLVGGELNDAGTNARVGGGPFTVAEADESDGSFLLLRPRIGVVTNIEADHLDHWRSLDAIREAFRTWVLGVRSDGVAVLPSSEHTLIGVARERGLRVITFGRGGDVGSTNVNCDADGADFVLSIGQEQASVRLGVPGTLNIDNALAAAAACYAAGLSVEACARGLGAYRGVGRRYQRRGTRAQVTVIDDYAHHPTEVRRVIEAARSGQPRRVVAVFQPHRYSRTEALWREFGAAFEGADAIVVTEVYGAGEQPIPGVSGKLLTDAIAHRLPGRPVAYLPRRDELIAYLVRSARAGDAVLTLGAGDITSLGDDLLSRVGGGS